MRAVNEAWAILGDPAAPSHRTTSTRRAAGRPSVGLTGRPGRRARGRRCADLDDDRPGARHGRACRGWLALLPVGLFAGVGGAWAARAGPRLARAPRLCLVAFVLSVLVVRGVAVRRARRSRRAEPREGPAERRPLGSRPRWPPTSTASSPRTAPAAADHALARRAARGRAAPPTPPRASRPRSRGAGRRAGRDRRGEAPVAVEGRPGRRPRPGGDGARPTPRAARPACRCSPTRSSSAARRTTSRRPGPRSACPCCARTSPSTRATSRDARPMGADAVLLIVAALDDAELARPARAGRRARASTCWSRCTTRPSSSGPWPWAPRWSASTSATSSPSRSTTSGPCGSARAMPDGVVRVAESGIRGPRRRRGPGRGRVPRRPGGGVGRHRGDPRRIGGRACGPPVGSLPLCSSRSAASPARRTPCSRSPWAPTRWASCSPPSPRQLAPARAADIVKRLPPEILTVGVFRDDAAERVVDVVHQAGLAARAAPRPRDGRGHPLGPRAGPHASSRPSRAATPSCSTPAAYGADIVLLDSASPGLGPGVRLVAGRGGAVGPAADAGRRPQPRERRPRRSSGCSPGASTWPPASSRRPASRTRSSSGPSSTPPGPPRPTRLRGQRRRPPLRLDDGRVSGPVTDRR